MSRARLARLSVVLLLPLACTGEKPGDTADTGDTSDSAGDTSGDSGDSGADSGDSGADSGDSGDSGADSGALDRDDDGYAADEDCDDTDPGVNPGATEAWNGVDDDCDGTADANGTYTGTVPVVATAIYKGRSHRYDLDCPATLVRAAPTLTWAITCTPDPTDELEVLLLGETLTISGEDDAIGGPSWSGRATFASSSGWDTDGDGTATWTDFSHVALTVVLNTTSLDVSGGATLAR